MFSTFFITKKVYKKSCHNFQRKTISKDHNDAFHSFNYFCESSNRETSNSQHNAVKLFINIFYFSTFLRY